MVRWADRPLSDALFLLFLLSPPARIPPFSLSGPLHLFPFFSLPAAVDCGIVITGPEVSPALCEMCSLADTTDFDPQ